MWCRAVGDQAAARHPKVTGGKAAVSGLESGHFRRQFHRSSNSSCKFPETIHIGKNLISASTWLLLVR